MNQKLILKERREKSHNTYHTSQNSGITLVALIITIIVLLILAVVAIRAVSNDGIISHAKNARAEYEKGQIKEETKLSEYEQYIASLGERTLEEITIENAQSVDMLERKQNTQTHDKYGNKIVVLAGFKILVDNTTDYTADTIDVTKGIVIQDVNGNEFVWIPVGDIYTTTDEEKNSSNTTPIILGRYSWSGSTPTLVQPTESNPYNTSEVAITSGSYTYTELQPTENGKGPNGNAIAKNINNFYEKAIASHGYYIGRFEAGKENDTLVCKANQTVYANVTQIEASSLSQSMYTNKPYESDLINSYAWDTAIVFIQTFGANGDNGKETDSSTYARKNNCNGLKQTGANQKNEVPDKYRNIYDMSGNAYEWSTETSSNSYGPCAKRGGSYTINPFMGSFADYCTSYRHTGSTTGSYNSHHSFRPLLYV